MAWLDLSLAIPSSGARGQAPAPPAAITSLTVMNTTILDPDGSGFGIDGNGWVVRVVMPYVVGATFDPKKLLFTVQDPGYDNAKNVVTRTRYIQGGKVIRRQLPNGVNLQSSDDGTTLTAYFSIEDLIYQGSTIIGCQAAAGFYGAAQSGAVTTLINNSVRGYYKPGLTWLNLQHERATGSTHSVEAAASHRHMMNGQQVACIEFFGTDGTNTSPGALSSTPALSTKQINGKIAEVFKAAVLLGALTQATLCNVNAKVYPWIGDASSVLDLSTDGAAWPTALPKTQLRFLNDKNGTYGGAHAFVKIGASGGAVSLDQTAARTTPFPTSIAAIAALATFNNTTSAGHTDLHNDHSGSRIWLMDTDGAAADHTFAGNIPTATGLCWTTFAVDPAATATVRISHTALRSFSGIGLYRFACPVVQSGAFNLSGGSDVNNAMLAFDGSTMDAGGNTGAAVNYRVGLTYFRNVTILNANSANSSPLQSSGAARREMAPLALGVIHTDATANMGCFAYAIIGCTFKRYTLGELPSTFTQVDAPDGQLIINNLVIDSRATSIFGSTRAKTALFMLQNVFESANKVTGPCVQIGADGMTVALDNIVSAYNTIPGNTSECRRNWGYADVLGSVGVVKRIWSLFEIVSEYDCKTDTFTTNTSATGRTYNWEIIHGVGFVGVVCLRGATDGSTVPGYKAPTGNWLGEYWPANCKPFVTAAAVPFTDDKAGGSAALGGGTYTLTGAVNAAYDMVPAGRAGLSFDMNGVARRNDGTGAAGAYERTIG